MLETRLRLATEQQTRTDNRVRALLQPRQAGEDSEIFSDTEETNRILGRRARFNRDQATQTNSSSLSFCCGVFVGVFGVVCFVGCLIFLPTNDRQRLAK